MNLLRRLRDTFAAARQTWQESGLPPEPDIGYGDLIAAERVVDLTPMLRDPGIEELRKICQPGGTLPDGSTVVRFIERYEQHDGWEDRTKVVRCEVVVSP